MGEQNSKVEEEQDYLSDIKVNDEESNTGLSIKKKKMKDDEIISISSVNNVNDNEIERSSHMNELNNLELKLPILPYTVDDKSKVFIKNRLETIKLYPKTLEFLANNELLSILADYQTQSLRKFLALFNTQEALFKSIQDSYQRSYQLRQFMKNLEKDIKYYDKVLSKEVKICADFSKKTNKQIDKFIEDFDLLTKLLPAKVANNIESKLGEDKLRFKKLIK